MSAPDFIPRDVRARLKDVRLIPRRAAGTHGFGLHRSTSRGAGLEFAQYRAYEPGDELRQIDWKLYARSDRFFVRESERESPIPVWLLIDATASMTQADAARKQWTRLDAARSLAACLIEVALRQGDAFGIATLGGHGLDVVPASAGLRHRDRCLLALRGIHAEGAWPAEATLRPLWERIVPGALVVMLGDGFDDNATAFAQRLSAARREVLSIRILTTEERDFPFRGGHRFVDAESGAELLADAAAVRSDFLARFTAARRALNLQLAANGIRQVEYVLDEALDAPLRRLFAMHGDTESA
ncbi:DUF58 domain-containing protein [Lysobacter yangpyeongensis]|uniref:DUF58 domain-containing protein n=1 Tax=Lysobacter yangpyeongensis TaxID=346182 RepID=A0ABW0SKV5_9GAMM